MVDGACLENSYIKTEMYHTNCSNRDDQSQTIIPGLIRPRTDQNEKKVSKKNERKRRLIQGSKSTQRTARLTNTKTKAIRDIVQEIEEERNLLSNREYAFAITIDERTRPPTTFSQKRIEWKNRG